MESKRNHLPFVFVGAREGGGEEEQGDYLDPSLYVGEI